MLILSQDGQILHANGVACRLLGTHTQAAEQAFLQDFLDVPAARAQRLLKRWARSNQMTPAALAIRLADGSVIKRRAQGALLSSGVESQQRILLVRLRDQPEANVVFSALDQRIADLTAEVSRRRRIEAQLRSQREVLESIGRSSSIGESLAKVVHLVENWTDGAIGSVLLLDEQGRLRLGAGPNLPDDYNAAIDGLQIGPNIGSCGTAAYLGRPVIVHNIATDPLWAEFTDLALAHGLAACWSYPVTGAAGRVLGTVAMYYPAPRSPSDEDTEITEVACRLVAIAIERDRSENSLKARAEQLLAADRRKDDFLAMLAHELRNPLSPVVAALELIDRDPESVGQHLPLLQRQVKHLTRIVNDLLDLTRVSRGLVELVLEPVEVGKLVRELVGSYQPAAQQRGLSVVAMVDGEPSWVYADADRLLQVIGNLITNAMRFSTTGGHVEVHVARQEGSVTVSVRDQGAGIDPKFAPYLFEAFSQDQPPVDRKDTGLGIGLTVARNLVEQHSGTIEAFSDGKGRGSEFLIHLPETAAPPPSEAPAETPELTGQGLSVLLVEDNVDAAELLSTLVGLWGHDCRVAHDGPTALRLIEEAVPRVAIMDIGLPEMDGYEVARRIRQDLGLASADCTLVALTGYGFDSDRKLARDAGFDEHFTKPVDPDALERLLAEVR